MLPAMEYGWVGTVAALAAAFGAGSLLTRLLDVRKERLAARADVLAALHVVDTGRFQSGPPGFDAKLRELRRTALLAHLPRRPVEEHVDLARALRSLAVWRRGEPDANHWDMYLENAATTSSEAVTDLIWHPLLGRWRLKARRVSMMNELKLIRPDLGPLIWGDKPWI